MRCFNNCAFFTENRIAVFTKDVQLYLISFYLNCIIEIHCLNIQRYYVLFDAKQMQIQFIAATQHQFLKLAQYFFLILVSVFGLEIWTQCNVHNGLTVFINYHQKIRYAQKFVSLYLTVIIMIFKDT